MKEWRPLAVAIVSLMVVPTAATGDDRSSVVAQPTEYLVDPTTGEINLFVQIDGKWRQVPFDIAAWERIVRSEKTGHADDARLPSGERIISSEQTGKYYAIPAYSEPRDTSYAASRPPTQVSTEVAASSRSMAGSVPPNALGFHAAGLLMPAIVGYLIAFGVGRLLTSRRLGTVQIVVSFLASWLLATLLRVVLGSNFLAPAPEGVRDVAIGLAAASAVLTVFLWLKRPVLTAGAATQP